MMQSPMFKRSNLVLRAERIGKMAEVYRYATKRVNDTDIENVIADRIATLMKQGADDYGTSRWKLVDD